MDILIVDDSAAMRLLVMRTLRQAGFDGHDIAQAGDGVEALEHIRNNSVDLVMADWNMPNMTGIELLEALRADSSDLKLGFVTTEATSDMKQRANDAGAAFMISKPFNAESFEQALGSVIV